MPFSVENLSLEGLKKITPRVFNDNRGYFLEFFSEAQFKDLQIPHIFVQDNFSVSSKGVLRGLHFQIPQMCQAKLVTCLSGEIFDVAVDLRPDSTTFMKWEGINLKGNNIEFVYIPDGFAHGFFVKEGPATVFYKCSRDYSPKHDGGIRYDDPDIGIMWPGSDFIISEKDKNLPLLKNISNPFRRA